MCAFWRIDVGVRGSKASMMHLKFVYDGRGCFRTDISGSAYAYVEIPKSVSVKERGVMHWLNCLPFVSSSAFTFFIKT